MCHKFTASGLTFNNGFLGFQQMALPCKSWNCPECGKNKARIGAIKARKGFEGDHVRFATLTMGGNAPIAQQLLDIKAAWNRLRLTLTRNGNKLKYCWVLEACPSSGRPHLHVLLDRYINVYRLSNLAQKAGFGKVVDIRSADGKGVFLYVTKYLAKGIGSPYTESLLRRCGGRRISFSRGFLPKTEAEKTFFVTRLSKPTANMDELLLNAKAYVQRSTVKGELFHDKPWKVNIGTNIEMSIQEVEHLANGFKCGFLEFGQLDQIFEGHSPDHIEEEWLISTTGS